MRRERSTTTLPILTDRTCHPRFLVSPLRYWIAGPGRDLDPLALRRGDAIADLGAGAGFHANEILRRIGPEGKLVLVDIDRANLDLARSRVGEDRRVSYLATSAALLNELPPVSFDRVLLSLVLCCLVDKEGVIAQVWRILRPGGRVLITYPRRWTRLRGRRAACAMSAERWRELVLGSSWVEHYIRGTRWTVRHLLEKRRDDEQRDER